MSTPDLQTAVERYLADPSPAHREAAVLAGIPLVRSILGKVAVPDHPLAHLDDLEGAGLVGLLEALDAYDADRGARFVTFAYLRVRGSVIDYLRSLDVLSLDKRRLFSQVLEVADTLRGELGREPSDRAVAERAGIDLATYDALLVGAQARFALSLDAPAYDDDDPGSLADTLADPDDAFDDVEQTQTLGLARRAIEGLPSRTRAMLGMYYDDGLTLREIGQVFEVSEARVSQILGKAMLKIRATLEPAPARLAA